MPTPEDEPDPADEPDDAPHVDRALRRQLELDGDRVLGRGFAIEGVPEDFTFYWPRETRVEDVYLVYDEAFDHVATITSRPRVGSGVAAAELDTKALNFEETSAFAVWESKFAATQKKKGPGRRTRFESAARSFEVELLVDLPWLLEGFTFER